MEKITLIIKNRKICGISSENELHKDIKDTLMFYVRRMESEAHLVSFMEGYDICVLDLDKGARY